MATHRSLTRIWTLILLAVVQGLGVSLAQEACACSRFLWNTATSLDIQGQPTPKDLPVLVGRSMDWMVDTHQKFRGFPRGIHRDGLAGKNSLTWTSKYGSLVLTFDDTGTLEGMNEAGLTVALLFLRETDYGDRDVNRPGLNQSIWVQYILDNFTNVHDAIEDMRSKNIQIIPTKLTKLPAGSMIKLHMAIGDAKGDSAIIEYINGGQLRIYHNPDYNSDPDVDYTVMTNQPTYDQQISNLKKYIRHDPTTVPYYFVNKMDPNPPHDPIPGLPGSLIPEDRFVRLFYYGHIMYKPQDQYQAASHLFSLLGNITIPFNRNPDDYPTLWTSVMDLTHRAFYFSNIAFRPSVVWVNMSKLDFSPHALQREYDVEHGPAGVSGDITNLFKLSIAKPFVFKDSDDNYSGTPE